MLKCASARAPRHHRFRLLPWLLWPALLLLLTGCAGTSIHKAGFDRPFVFGEDTFAYRNDLVWVYYRDPETGQNRHRPREPKPDYTHHCFVVARSARQFFQHARFDPAQPAADEATYRELIRQVVKASPRRVRTPEERVVIPGYTNLYQFSQGHEKLLKAECGSAWHSYFQRGHWRMIFPFTRGHQEDAVAEFQQALGRNCPVVLHVVRFPALTINHAVVVFGMQEAAEEVRFATYDPYQPDAPVDLRFDRKARRFFFPANDYFVGGRVDAYEVYCSWNY